MSKAIVSEAKAVEGFEPFENKAISLDELEIESTPDGISFRGSLDIDLSDDGLMRANLLRELVEKIVKRMEGLRLQKAARHEDASDPNGKFGRAFD